MLPKRPKTAINGRKKVKDTFLYRISSTKTSRKRIPQVWRIPQYRNSRLKLPKYRMKNWPIPQYRKPQCPPRSMNSLVFPLRSPDEQQPCPACLLVQRKLTTRRFYPPARCKAFRFAFFLSICFCVIKYHFSRNIVMLSGLFVSIETTTFGMLH